MSVISGGQVVGPGRLMHQELTLTEDTANSGAGAYSATVTIPGGCYIVDVIVHAVAVWNSSSAVTLIVGDAVDDDCYFTGVDLKATDIIAAEGLSLSGGTGLAGGKVGADIANSQWNRRYLATARVIKAKATAAGASGTTGVTRVLVIYTDPTIATAATFA
jgi:hypothetical protein